MAAKRFERARSAGENDHLLLLPRTVQRIEHLLDPSVIREYQGVVEDDRHFLATLAEQGSHGETNKNGELLLRPDGKTLESLCRRPVPFEASDVEAITDLEFGGREDVAEKRLKVPAERSVETLTLLLIANLNRLLQKLKRGNARPVPLDLAVFDLPKFAKCFNRLSDAIPPAL